MARALRFNSDRRELLRWLAAAGTTFPVLAGSIAERLVWAAPQSNNPADNFRDMPENPSWRIVIPPAGEPGEPLVVSGTIFAEDGRTPVPGAILFVYHTDARGYYNTLGSGRVARLRGWMKTDAQGRYEFQTIRPAPYPGREIPAHIHATVRAASYPDQFIEEFLFEGDRYLSAQEIAKDKGAGRFAHILKLDRDAAGVLRGQRDIRLQHHP